jgi:hypothetical protein
MIVGFPLILLGSILGARKREVPERTSEDRVEPVAAA